MGSKINFLLLKIPPYLVIDYTSSMNGNPQITLLIVGVTVLLLIGVVAILFVVFYQKKRMQEEVKKQRLEIDYQRKMLRIALEMQENERRRISKDLHDDVGMMLMTLRIGLSSQSNNDFSELIQLVDKTHESVQKISWDLMPSTLENFGLFQSLQEMCERLSLHKTTTVSYNEEGKRLSLDKDQELLVYRIVQEATTNSLKHSHAPQIDVNFLWTKNSLFFTIADDGLGFDLSSIKNKIPGRHGLGLYNLENRVALLGGELTLKKNEPSGTVVSVILPLIYS